MIPPETTGFTRPDEALSRVAVAGRSSSAVWITADLIAQTCSVWSRHLGRPIGEAEAVEMLTNVRDAAVAILAAGEGIDL
jgi:hypothetical protein